MTARGAEWMTQEAPSYHKIHRFREQRSCGLMVDDAKLDDVAYLILLPLAILCLMHIVGCCNSFLCIHSSLPDCVD
jgi:hypothetical protein